MKRMLSLLLMLALLASMLPGVLAAGPVEPQAVTYQESGLLSVNKPSLSQLQQMYKNLPSYGSDLFATQPVASGDSSYKVGSLSSKALTYAQQLVNYYRQAAGVGSIKFTTDANTSSSWGALLLAMSEFSHRPPKPVNMKTEDFDQGYYATTHSNISGYYTSNATNVSNVLNLAISGQMNDSDANNISTLGHRRWLLNPATQTMGIGSAKGSTTIGGKTYTAFYTDVSVFGKFVTTKSVSDYDFISWPASGANLSETFTPATPWSISLNPDRYQSFSGTDLTVTLTHEGTTWTFTYRTGTAFDDSKDYFTVDNSGYGVSNCIIFRPSPKSVGSTYSGIYTVRVQGLKDASGNSTELNYRVNFVSVNTACAHKTTNVQNKIAASCTEKGYTGDTVCYDCGSLVTKGKDIPALGHSWNEGEIVIPAEGRTEGLKRFTCTRCDATKEEKYHICPAEDYTDRLKDTSWAHASVDFCIETGLMGSVSSKALTFAPNATLKRNELVTILWRLEGSPVVETELSFTDVNPTAWYYAPVMWAAENSIVAGNTDGSFAPNTAITRENFAVILYRYSVAKGLDVTASGDLSAFADGEKVHEYGKAAMLWAASTGLIQGTYKDGLLYLDYKGTTLRSQAAAILMRYCLLYEVL